MQKWKPRLKAEANRPDDGQLGEGHRWQLHAIRQSNHLHPTRALGGVVFQTLGHFFLFCGETKR